MYSEVPSTAAKICMEIELQKQKKKKKKKKKRRRIRKTIILKIFKFIIIFIIIIFSIKKSLEDAFAIFKEDDEPLMVKKYSVSDFCRLK